MGLIDLMAVGGSGGHFSPEYFDYIRIPKFPDQVIDTIVSQYSSTVDINFGSNVKEMKDINLNDYGIVQLDRKVKILKEYISGTISKILNDERV